MKPVKSLEGEVNYRPKATQQVLRRVDNNYKSFFNASKDFQKNSSRYQGKLKPPRFKQQPHDNLIYDYQAFSIKDEVVCLEKGSKIKLPKQIDYSPYRVVELGEIRKLSDKKKPGETNFYNIS